MCKKNAEATCLEKQDAEYMKDIEAPLKIVQNPAETPSKKRKASEEIGGKAAIAANAKRHKIDYDTSKKAHTEFSGCSVPDFTYKTPTGKYELKEAKGGKSSYGERRNYAKTKKVKQCTPEYSKELGLVMQHSNYKGRHPTVLCAVHALNPPLGKNTCSNCRAQEATHRQQTGKDIGDAYKTQNLVKVGVRGDYNETCAQVPKIMDEYGVDKNGKRVDVH